MILNGFQNIIHKLINDSLMKCPKQEIFRYGVRMKYGLAHIAKQHKANKYTIDKLDIH